MDGWLEFYVLFNSISVIAGRGVDEIGTPFPIEKISASGSVRTRDR